MTGDEIEKLIDNIMLEVNGETELLDLDDAETVTEGLILQLQNDLAGLHYDQEHRKRK